MKPVMGVKTSSRFYIFWKNSTTQLRLVTKCFGEATHLFLFEKCGGIRYRKTLHKCQMTNIYKYKTTWTTDISESKLFDCEARLLVRQEKTKVNEKKHIPFLKKFW